MTPELWALLVAVTLAVLTYFLNRALKKQVGPPSIAEMWKRIEKLEDDQRASTQRENDALTKANTAEEASNELKLFIVEWMSRLLDWDSSGRKGRMPLPSDDELSRLDIKHP